MAHANEMTQHGYESTNAFTERNISELERWLSAGAGVGLVVCGLARRTSLSLVGVATGASLLYRAYTGHCYLYQALGVNTFEGQQGATAVPAQQGARVDASIEVNAPAETLYRFWRVLENLPEVAPHLESVRETNPKLSHWVARTPLGGTVEWDAEILEDRLGELISWRSLPGSVLSSAGSVRFKEVGAGEKTLVTLQLKYDPPGGTVSAKVAELLGLGMQEPVEEALLRFKTTIEAKERTSSKTAPTDRQEDKIVST
jgi:uncharacterized membrane protein